MTDTLIEWEYAIASMRAQHVAGRKLTPAEAVRMVDATFWQDRTPLSRALVAEVLEKSDE